MPVGPCDDPFHKVPDSMVIGALARMKVTAKDELHLRSGLNSATSTVHRPCCEGCTQPYNGNLH